MTLHARDVLEFARVLQGVAGRAASPQGRAHVEALLPLPVEQARNELDRVRAVMSFQQERPGWGMPAIPAPEAALTRLELPGGVLEPSDLHRVGVLLASARVLAREMDGRAALDPHLARLRERLWIAEEVERDVVRTVDEDGTVLDSASRALKQIRDRLRGAHQRIVRQLDRYLGSLPDRLRVPDASVSVREGRYVIPLRREGRREVGGIVHDESGTGATIFVEPPVAVELMNELRDLEREEAREIQRVLRDLSARLHPFHADLACTLRALVELDSLHARARAALAWRAHPPVLATDSRAGFRVVSGRHPLLLEGEAPVVPFDLEMAPEERTLLVSGPNTGGKSVFLKAVGLISLLARSGVVPPVGKGTVLPGVTRVYADIGDEQSIAESLSTFSAHLATMREILREADADALVLMDELGTGTDPEEGAALARAILETLTARGCLTLATSHLGALKVLDTEGSGIVNASMQFDAEAMEPTYRLEKGRPGRSYGLAIARRLGLSAPVLERARALVQEGAASLESLLERLERREREARERADDLAREQERVARLAGDLERREATLRDRERTAEERARRQARELLMNAREEVEAAIRTVRSAGEAAPEAETGEGGGLDRAAREARRRVEEAAERQRRRSARVRTGAGVPAAAPDPAALRPGMRVRVGSGSTRGTLVELRDDRGVVEVSGLRMEVPARELEVVAETGGPDAPARSRERGWSGDLPTAGYEIDLRGLRVDEVALELGRSLDGAILNDLAEVRIIHGKGTGAVKARVREILEQDARVASFRNGHPGEGGGGVTLAVFR
ncbi:MAG: Smr/MutS family protein [Longimicrobiales bacterium]|nr:Smr/MutS family protein [Longimicrobiales bacterium]